MPDSKKITIKTKVTINTISNDVDTQDNASTRHQRSPDLLNRDSSLNGDEGRNGENRSRRQSWKRQSQGKKVLRSNVESINLQENNEQRPVQLKASFLRRKMKEYEGNKNFPSSYKICNLCKIVLQA